MYMSTYSSHGTFIICHCTQREVSAGMHACVYVCICVRMCMPQHNYKHAHQHMYKRVMRSLCTLEPLLSCA